MSLDPEAESPPDAYRPLDFAGSGGGWSSSVWWLYAPVLLLLGFALWQRSAGPRAWSGHGEPSTPDSLSASAIVDGWSVRVPGVDGRPAVTLRLEPLHPVPTRQAFDASVLLERFAVDGRSSAPGAQPWRLTVAAPRPKPKEQTDAKTRADTKAREALPDLSGVRIEGLEPLVGTPSTAADGPLFDPLATLLRFPSVPLREGEACDLVFWGPRPGENVVVTAPGLDSPAVLRQLARSTSPSSGAIARIDARGGQDTVKAAGSRPR